MQFENARFIILGQANATRNYVSFYVRCGVWSKDIEKAKVFSEGEIDLFMAEFIGNQPCWMKVKVDHGY